MDGKTKDRREKVETHKERESFLEFRDLLLGKRVGLRQGGQRQVLSSLIQEAAPQTNVARGYLLC